ncbi:MAG TPA: glycoside hydrolase family 3 N-terminal domain-containing protein [Terriglobales bacterium]|jgi:beta-glucosidase|nr:glycoside hydrolase family 3 N-terminal domain-containing protein [Terriglobales bacterium]
MWFRKRRAGSTGSPIDSLILGRGLNSWDRKARVLLLAALCTVVVSASLWAQVPTSVSTAVSSATGIADPKLDARVEAVLRSMTLEEKVGQLVQYSAGQATGPGTGRSDYKDMIAQGQIGSLLNVRDTPLINEYQRIAVEKSRMHIPLLFGLDVIHGFRTEFPIPLGMASTWDPGLVEKASHVAALEASAIGIRWTFSPMVDIARDARWGRMAEGAGEDPFLGSAMAAAYVRGYQGAHLDAPDSIGACVKHFVGYGAAEGGRDYNTTEISDHTLREFYLPPFHAAVDAGTATLMSAFNSLNGVPSSANPFTLTQILRKEWGFKGMVVSDWSSIGELVAHGIAVDDAAAARKAFLAGVDMDMTSSLYHDHLVQLVRSGAVPEANVDESVRRVLRVKFALGLFEHPYTDEGRAKQVFFLPENLQLAQTVAERSFVLLKNTSAVGGKPLLPISNDVKTVAVIGPLADNPSDPEGSSPQHVSGVLSFPAELARRLGEGHVIREKGVGILKSSGNDKDEISAAVAAAKRADLAILTLGESPDMSGEAASRSDLGLPGRQQELLEAIVNTGKPVVLILFSGRPLTLPWAFEHVPAVLAAWLPGTEAGAALARTLFGESDPSGRLVVSWPRSVGQEPLYYNALSTGRPPGSTDLTRPPYDTESRYVSRYIDEQNSPQFPFGYGESYTSFRFGATEVTKSQLSATALNQFLSVAGDATSILTAATDISNTGSRAGEELVQLYIRLEGTSTAQPVRALKGFERIALAPGETKRVIFNLTPDAFAIWNDRNQFAVEPANVTVWISPDSASGSDAKLKILP